MSRTHNIEEPTGDVGSLSDGFHTFDELYEYRMLYNAEACLGWLQQGVPVVKSRRHSDGELCFGGGWFIVVATLPTGQVSNHYQDEHWDLFHVSEVDTPPTFDGHTPHDVSVRLRQHLETLVSPSRHPHPGSTVEGPTFTGESPEHTPCVHQDSYLAQPTPPEG